MSMRKFLFTFILGSFALGAFAQDAAPSAPYRSFSPADQWEVGVNLGLPYVNGDLDAKFPGFGGGLHVRKSLDHIFSLRVNTLFGKASNETAPRTSDLTWIGGGGELVVALNNLIFNKPYRKFLINAYGGLGATSYKTNFENITQVGASAPSTGDISGTTTYMNGGLGISYRINKKVNLGLEYTVYSAFGKSGDLLDGEANVGNNYTTYRDNLHFPHLSVCFNLGGKDKVTGLAKPEPRYWANPLEGVSTAISALEARPIYNPNDADNDGIIDDIDTEDDSPAGARVDTKGVTLDSDSDKVPDFKDKEPYSPPGYKVDAQGVAQVPKPNWVTEADVNRIVDAKLANFKLPAPSINDWFFPMVNFETNSYTVRRSEFEKLYQVAQVMKSNPNIKVVVTGNTDRTSSERYNNVLSYNRANAAIAHLTSQYGIARDRLILNWAGEASAIIPTDASNLTNRRVEFRVAKGETEMARPEGPEAGKGRIEGNKSGY